jgi:hypothetical protein
MADMGIEDSIDKKRRLGLELSPTFIQAYARAEKINTDPAYAIQEDEFRGVYTDEQIKKDKQTARDLEQN